MDTITRKRECIETALFFATVGGIGLLLEAFLPGIGVVFVASAGAARYWPSK